MWARVLLLPSSFALSALVLGGALLWLGGFMQDNVRTELSSQQISFNAADRLTDEERAIPGLSDNAGQPVTTAAGTYLLRADRAAHA
jgi:hypothetical protein